MELQSEAKSYLLQFLTGIEDESLFRRFRIGYTDRQEFFGQYDLVIVPSGFFESPDYGKEESLPSLPLPRIEGVPFFYGTDRVETVGKTKVIHADLLASAFFLLSRYEEICRRDCRDRHGRFPGKASILYKSNLIFRPLVDEYARLVRKWLRETGAELPEPKAEISKVWLTHDIDEPFYCKGFRSFLRESIKGRGVVRALRFALQASEKDPYQTFGWFAEKDADLKKRAELPVQSMYFVKAGGKSVYDKPVYSLKSRRMSHLLRKLLASGASLGWHGSYSSGEKGADPQEKARLERFTGKSVLCFRAHYLRSCEPEHFQTLESLGITDDFTMGYADVAGFRLGTCRPVVWIDPFSGRLSQLVLHPLTVMDNTLYQVDYMGLDYETAFKYCTMLFHTVRQFGGEICVLWHNTTVIDSDYPQAPVSWMRRFYEAMLDYLDKMN